MFVGGGVLLKTEVSKITAWQELNPIQPGKLPSLLTPSGLSGENRPEADTIFLPHFSRSRTVSRPALTWLHPTFFSPPVSSFRPQTCPLYTRMSSPPGHPVRVRMLSEGGGCGFGDWLLLGLETSANLCPSPTAP